MPNVNFSPALKFAYDNLDDAFPNVDPGHMPMGDKILVQLRVPKTKTKSGIIIAEDNREAEQWNTQVGKVIALGPMCFCNRNTGEKWPEGDWFTVGEFIRIPKFRGDIFNVKSPSGENILFALIRDLDISAKLTCDPRGVLTFI